MKPKFGLLALITILATVLTPVQLITQGNTSLIKDASAQAQTTQERSEEAFQLYQLGVQQYEQGQFREALKTYQQVLRIVRAIGDRQGEGAIFNYIGQIYNSLGQYTQALKYSQQALTIHKQVGDKAAEGTALTNIGGVYNNLGQYTQALKYSQQALTIHKQVGNKAWEGTTLINIGSVYDSLGQYSQALKYSQQGLTIHKQVGDKAAEGTALTNIGGVYNNLGQYAQALKYHQQALVIAQQVGDKAGEGLTFNNIGSVYQRLGQYAQALKYFQQALTIHQQVGDKAAEGTILNNIGGVYKRLGQYAQALKYFQQALTIHQQVGDKAREGTILNNIGGVYQRLGQYAQALKYYQQALTIYKQVGDKAGEGTTLNNIGEVYNYLGQYTQALKYSQQALTIHQQVGNKAGEGAALNNIAGVYNNLGQYAQALKYYQQALTIRKQVGDKAREGTILNNIGGVYSRLGQYAQALKYYQQALTIRKQVGDKVGEGTILNNIGGVYNRLGQYSEAEKTLFSAINVLESLRKGLTDADKISIFDTRAGIYGWLQHALVAQSKTNTALEIAERGRARAFVELLASQLSSQSETQSTVTPPTALQMQQIAKAQNATLIQYSIIDDPIKVQGKEEWRESRLFIWVIPPTGRIIFRWVDLKPLLKQNTSLSELAPNSPSVVPVTPNSPAIETPTPESGQEITTPWSNPIAISLIILIGGSIIGIGIWGGRFLLTKKAAENSPLKQRLFVPSLLLVLAIGSSGGLFFWMTRSQVLANNRDFRNDSLLAQLIDSTRESVKTRGRGLGIVPLGQKANQGDRLQQLHQILIQPIADLLPTDPNARVIFIPQSSLFLVPFPALKDASGKYLIEKHTILTAPSIQTLDLTRQQKQRVGAQHVVPLQGKDALVVGNPTMPKVPPQIGEPPQQLPSLPGAEQEAKAIAKLLKTTALTGNQATKQAVLQKMAGARIVHLATHGILDDFRGLGSAIALAPDSSPSSQGGLGGIDGLLTAEEILDLKLNAELVALSACDTGRGKITGDGVVGLSRSLISAGVPSVLVSLWSVPDAPTAFLMTEFYRNWQQNPDKAQALRQAMLTTMKQHPNPRDWAAFTLIGEAD